MSGQDAMLGRVRVLVAVVLLCACSGEAPRTGEPAAATKREPPRQEVAAPAPPPDALPAPAPVAAVKTPERGCALANQRTLRGGAQKLWLAHDRGQLAALVLGQDDHALELWRGASLEALALTASARAASGIARLGLHSGERDLALVFVDDKGGVNVARAADMARTRVVAAGADRRFAPAFLAHAGREFVAFTRTVDDAMHTFLLRLDGESAVDVTPAGHGAAAPAFVIGAGAPALIAIDARAGVSPLLEIPIRDGAAEPAIVRTPVSQPYAPPLLAAVELSNGDVEVAYTAIGRLAATAVGRVPLRKSSEPVALLPSKGYGALALAAARGPRRAAFALESPRSESPDAPRSIEVKLLDEQGEGPTLVLAGDGPSAREPSLARGRGASELWLGYVQDGQAQLATLHCSW
jgi:hypothetical protein